MAEFEKKNLENLDNKPYLLWRYIDDIFFVWEHDEEKLKYFVETLNEISPKKSLLQKRPRKSVIFFDLTAPLTDS